MSGTLGTSRRPAHSRRQGPLRWPLSPPVSAALALRDAVLRQQDQREELEQLEKEDIPMRVGGPEDSGRAFGPFVRSNSDRPPFGCWGVWCAAGCENTETPLKR